MKRDELFKILEGMDYKRSLIFEFKNGVVFKAKFGTSFETDNNLDDDDPNYIEYYACLFRVLKILKGKELLEGAEGQLIEISILNLPSKVYYEEGQVVWWPERGIGKLTE